ncbi:MAG: PASTA domain-containing protein [Desulfoarculaceae bacterium]|nr:PASTA domain-containing protein [Desulfoarculaceae bacterium]
MALTIVVAGLAVVYKKEIVGLARMVSLELGKATEKKKNIRGTIYDRKFKEVAVSLDRVSVYVRPRELEDIHESAGQLATVLGMNEQELTGRLDKDSQRVWLAKDISLEEEKAVTDLQLPGVFLHQEQVRYYPYKGTAAHMIGFADHNMGLAGTEYYYNRLLNQASISQDDFPHVNLDGCAKTGISGQHLVLTIDLKIQEFLEKYVEALALLHEGVEIVTLLMETETGAVVASANFPSFDPNLFYQYKKESLANLLLQPVVIPEKIRGFFQDVALLQADWARYGQIYPWSIAAGPVDRGLESHLWEQLGLSAVPDLDFSVQDGSGNVDGPGKVPAVLGSEAAGMPVMATPMQILLGMNSLLNGGRQVLPHVLDRVLERNGEREYFFRASVAGDGQGPSDALETISGGRGEQRQQLSHPVLVETWKLFKAQGHKEVLNSVFVDIQDLSFSPAEYLRTRMMFVLLPEDKPELILMVMVRQPYLEPSVASAKNRLDLAGPAAKILPSMVALHQVHKNVSDMMRLSEKEEGNYQQEQEIKSLVEQKTILKQHNHHMPDLSGLSLRRALRLLQDKKVKVRIQGSGRVVAQNPVAGTPLAGVKECLLILKKDEKDDKEPPAKHRSVTEEKPKNAIERTR